MFQPLIIAAIIGASSVLFFASKLLPNELFPEGRLRYLLPVLALLAAGLPFLAWAELQNRPKFTALLRKTIGADDLISPETFYASSEASGVGGIWVFQHGDEVVGSICVDASETATKPLESVLGDEEGQINENHAPVDDSTSTTTSTSLRQRKTTAASSPFTPTIAQIRHLDVDFGVRNRKVGSELVATALDAAFGTHPDHPTTTSINRVVILTNPLSSLRFLSRLGFQTATPESGWAKPVPVGLLGKQGKWMAVNRERWEAARRALYADAEAKAK